ncbi:MAG: BlaI/MecI/CopY family transcriptional regulator, partial [Bacteroidota bacterium]
MKKLTKAEEEIMQVLWEIGEGAVGDIRNRLTEKAGGKQPAHSTISTMMKILGEKGFVSHKAFGRTFVYRPNITKKEYSHQSLRSLAQNYFGGSTNRLVSFLIREEELKLDELNDLISRLDDDEPE